MALTFNFALEGFRTIRERPKLILFWGAVSLFGNGLGGIILVAFSGPAFATAISIGDKPVADSLRLDLLHQMMPGIGACLPLLFLTFAILNGAVCRAGLEGGDDRFGFLRFGLSEIRILLVLMIKFVLGLTVFFAMALVAQAGAMAVPAGAAGLQMAGLLAAAGGVIWLEIRLSLSVPQTFATRRLDIFGSFALTHGRFWPLLRGYASAAGLTLCVAFLCGKIAAAILGFAFGEKAVTAFPDVTSLQAYLTPQTITNDCLSNGLVMPLLLAILLGAPVAAYRALVPAAGREEP